MARILRLERATRGRTSGKPLTNTTSPARFGAMVAIRTVVPADAFTADILGTERTGNGVIVRDDGIVLTIGYLVTEASEVWMTLSDGRILAGHVIGYDQETGFGLIQALGRLNLPALELGDSDRRHARHRRRFRRRRRHRPFDCGAGDRAAGVRRLLGVSAR